MIGILAIETSTDACSVALGVDGVIVERHEIAPRQHQQRLFSMLRELLVDGDLRKHGIDALAYGCGPGSFTGLRIAASAVQGLAYACELPVIPVSTLALLAQTALRQAVVSADSTVLSILDARMGEVYSAVYTYQDGLAVLQEGPRACSPGELSVGGGREIHAVGSGCRFFDQFSVTLQQRICTRASEQLPAARDIIPLAMEYLARGQVQSPEQVQPVYVREKISWKKLSEQGKRG